MFNQYIAFLNAVAATDTYGLYREDMATDPNVAGIARSGVSGSYTYSAIGSGNRPVTYVSWLDAARFVNWLHNGQPTGLPAAGTTETGAYTLNGATSGTDLARNTNWTYGLPSEDEWYKAAYYQPAGQGGDSDDYWLYPTASDEIPNSRNGSASDPNSANFYRDDGIDNGFNGGYAVSQSPDYSASQQYLTDVGAFSVAHSFYGTFDQGGNLWEWNDAVIEENRGFRGGSCLSRPETELSALYQWSRLPSRDGGGIEGFRVVVSKVPPVRLKIARQSNQAVLSWPGAEVGFGLQKTTSLSAPSWSAVTDPVVVVGDQNTITVNLTGGESYYRLKK